MSTEIDETVTAATTSVPVPDVKFTDTPEGVADRNQRGAAYTALCKFEQSRHPRFLTILADAIAQFVFTWPGFADTLAPQIINNEDPQFGVWNSTSVGNLCLIETFAESAVLRQRCTALRERYYEWTLVRQRVQEPALEMCVIL